MDSQINRPRRNDLPELSFSLYAHNRAGEAHLGTTRATETTISKVESGDLD